MTEKNIYAPYDLRCQYVREPLGLDSKYPLFSWVLKHDEMGQFQTAYQVIVSDDPDLIEKGQGNMWDSGVVQSGDTANVVYNGEELKSRTRYYWRVRWWDKNGDVSPYSEVAVFETAFLDQSDWKAKWIGNGSDQVFEAQSDGFKPQQNYQMRYGSLFRKEFIAKKPVKSARIYISGLGYYELHINGCRVGDRVLDPGQTDYKKTVLYSTYDVTGFLKEGANAIGVMLGNGRYIANYGYGAPCLIAQLHIDYADGTDDVVVTDDTWKVGDSPIRENGIYYGETYDARLEIDGWDMPGLDDSNWDNAVLVDAPGGRLTSQVMPPIKVCKVMQPVKMTNPAPGVYIFDFGQIFTGWVRIKVEGERGQVVRLRYSELMGDDGMLNFNVNRTAEATDTYILKGQGVEVFEPHFTYHGFRYVEVTGYPGTPALDCVEGRFVHTAVEPVGSFACSNDLINNIHKNIIYSQLCNLMSIPTDCPQRDERMGWMGDAQLTAEEAIYNFDMAAFYAKYLNDIKDSQKEDGSIPDVVPHYWSIYPADPAWGTAYITIAWEMYRYYGDTAILKEHYDSMKKWVEFLSSQEVDGLVNYVHYGEWCTPGSIPPKHTPREITSAFYYYHDVLILSEIAGIIGKYDDQKQLREKADKIREAFNKKYYNSERHFYGNNDQTSNTLGLQLGITPEGEEKAVVENLVKHVVEQADYHFDTGIIGTKYILDTLSDYGYVDAAYKMMTQESYPSFGYMIREGATTLWERWEKLTGSGMNSQNHIMFGTVDAWFYKDLAGIKLGKPGWEEVIIKPVIPKGLKHAAASTKTIRGVIKSAWAIEDGEFTLEVAIPVNSKAKVYIPELWENKSLSIEGKEGPIEGLGVKDTVECGRKYYLVELGSGNYCIKLK